MRGHPDQLIAPPSTSDERRRSAAPEARRGAALGVVGSLRAVPRAGRVLRLLAHHGFLGALRGHGHWPAPEHVRAALEKLGVVYVKFGQVLAMRRDLLPPPYVEELERLTGAVVSGALVVAGALLVTATGWHHAAGDARLAVGVVGTLVPAIGAALRPRRA